MSDFPIELFNLLLSPQVSPQLRVEYIALGKLGVLPVDYVSSKLEKIIQFNNYRAQVLAAGSYTPEQLKEWLHLGYAPDRSKFMRDDGRINNLRAQIRYLDELIQKAINDAQSLQDKGFLFSDDKDLPRSLFEEGVVDVERVIMTGEGVEGLYKHRLSNKFAAFIKTKPIHILTIEELLKNLPEYEGKLVLTDGVVIGHGHNSSIVGTEGHYEVIDHGLYILRGGLIVEVNGQSHTWPNRLSVTDNQKVDAKGISFAYLDAHLDASKIAGSNIVVGGLVHDSKMFADMFVINVGANKQAFAYVR
ncbi:MAG TPA: hypothetical protein VJI52_05035 [Candidatus Nanoarchaeia archaeon]|nr:hypothetical protein [Candidatus Nanoarchaeia archaeon]